MARSNRVSRKKPAVSRRPKVSRKTRRVRYAVVGLGHIAQDAVLPAFRQARNAELVALVSGDAEKLKKVGRQYGVKALYSYEQYDELLASGTIDAVYIALPNDMHKDFTIRAARARVHVLCEKPLAMSVRDCEEMIRACEQRGVRLMTAYRLHFEKANLDAIERVKKGEIGEPRLFLSSFSFPVRENNYRVDPERGGGPLYDIGIYCINAARYVFQQEPAEVFGMMSSSGSRRELDPAGETCAVVLRFPEGKLAAFSCSFGAASTDWFHVAGSEGDLRLENAYDYSGIKQERVTVKGRARERKFPPGDQFAPELLYFSDCVLKDLEPEPSGIEGYADLRVIQAVLRSIEERRPISLAPFNRTRRPVKDQLYDIRARKEPKLVKVEEPSKKAA